ncbi:MAG: endolytic transglycosylase MltG [Eubacteriales bacterium]|nr:endolytic transglycosylase MltG [Eubacteriales bacterium]
MKKALSIMLCVVIILTGFIGCNSKSGEMITKTITVDQGESIFQIASKLKDEGIISNKAMFILSLVLSGYRSKLKYGTFPLSSDMTNKEILVSLAGGGISTEVAMITIPEGSSVQQIADIVDKSDIAVSSKDFYDALDDEYDYAFIKEIPNDGYDYKLQGFLFPSTYEFYIDASAHDIIDRLLSEFENQYKNAGENKTDMNMYQIITVASILEKEALIKSEIPIISGVIQNRRRAQMPLQICATVLYAVTEGMYDKTTVTYKDLEVKSLYNTYKNSGLPVGPISNPGLEAIKAALNPEKNDYLYYHTDEEKKDGSHIFTKTFQDHKDTLN